MGMQMNAQTNTTADYIKANKDVSQITYKRMFNPFLAQDWIFWFTKDYNILKNSLKIVHEINQKIISNRREELEKRGTQHISTVDEFGRKKKMAFLDILLQIAIDGKPISDTEIEDEVSTFMFAGHDTTGTALGFIFYCIAKYPEVQKKLSEEIFNVFGEAESRVISMKSLNELKYLELVIKESMRMYTPVTFIGRQLLEEHQIGMSKQSDILYFLNIYEPERSTNAGDWN